MPLSISRDRLASLVKATVVGEGRGLTATGVAFDSREVHGGELFVALKGEKSHGHDFVKAAYDRGAALFLVEHSLKGTPQESEYVREPERVLFCEDSLDAFTRLGSWWRNECKLPVVGVTGSVGKTTVKEMLAAILLQAGRGCYSLKSHNNHVGVPYTLCRINRDDCWAVIEMGMNHAGEIRRLTQAAQPDVAIITTVGPAHIEFFGSLAGIADAKFEIAEGLSAAGTLVLNGDDSELLQALSRHPQPRGRQIAFFGSKDGHAARLLECKSLGLEGISLRFALDDDEVVTRMRVPGTHNGMNACAAALAAKRLLPQLTIQQIGRGLETFSAPLMRLNILTLSDGRKVVDDSYNANPTSMRALLGLATELSREGARVGLILGDMLELGSFSEAAHREIGELVAGLKPKFFVAVGSWAATLVEPCRAHGVAAVVAESPELAGKFARRETADYILVKASRGVGLERAVKTIVQEEPGNG